MYKLSPILHSLGACSESLDWLAHEKHPTFADAWNACPEHEWMCWLLGRTMPHREIVALACDLAEPALVHTTDPHPAACIAVVRRWLRGEATIEEVREADALAAAYTATSSAYYVVIAAYYVVLAAEAAASIYAAVYAADVADRAADAAANAANAALSQSRNIIRARFPATKVESALIAYAHANHCLIESHA